MVLGELNPVTLSEILNHVHDSWWQFFVYGNIWKCQNLQRQMRCEIVEKWGKPFQRIFIYSIYELTVPIFLGMQIVEILYDK